MPIPLKKVAKRWMQEPGFKEGYDALGSLSHAGQIDLAKLFEARSDAVKLAKADVEETKSKAK